MDRTHTSACAKQRLDFLDSLRGIAALLVVLHHAYQTAPFWPSLVRYSPARLLLNGRSSVIFFFVLSGFVLAYGLWRGDQSTRFGVFLARRMARIYIPYVVAGCGALAAMLALQTGVLADAAITFNEMWSSPATAPTALAHLALLGTPEANGINTPSWSLVYELRISALIPFLCLCAVASARLLAVATLVGYGLCGVALSTLGLAPVPYAATGLLPNVVVTMHFTADFVLGILLAKAAVARSPWLFEMPARRRYVLGLGAAALLLVFRDETAAIGSAFVLILALNTPLFQRALQRPVLLWLGRISFSLYLTHMIVLQLVVRAFHGFVPMHVSILLALAVIAPVAILFHRWVEAPAARWSRQIGRPTRSAHPELAAA